MSSLELEAGKLELIREIVNINSSTALDDGTLGILMLDQGNRHIDIARFPGIIHLTEFLHSII